jgi:hypothetical protein
MSKIYDALVHAANNRHSRTVGVRVRNGHPSAGLLKLSSRNISLEWKITGAVASLILVFGFFLLIVGNQLMTRALWKETDRRALAITYNLSNAAVSSVVSNNILQLDASVTQYAQLQGVAYAFIEDRDGKIIANSIRPFPSELVGTSTRDARKQVDTRSVTLQGKTVYETRVPILEGQLGAAHLGVWAEEVRKELSTIRLTFIAVMVVLLLVVVALSVILVRAVIVPIGEQAGSSKPARAAISKKVRKTATPQRRQRTSDSGNPKPEKSPPSIEEPLGEP